MGDKASSACTPGYITEHYESMSIFFDYYYVLFLLKSITIFMGYKLWLPTAKKKKKMT